MEDNMAISGIKTALRFGRIACIISLLLNLPACGPEVASKVPYYTDASYTPRWEVPGAAPAPGHRIGYFSFTDQYGQPFGSKDVAGKIFLANFFFTSCKGICPRMYHTMYEVYRHFRNKPGILFLSHSVTPEMDSVGRLRQYALEHDITGQQWHLLTGNKEAIYAMARQNYFIEAAEGLSKAATEFLHTENLVLIDREGRIRGLYNGTLATEVPRIIEDISSLLSEK
jgi:protein SCO1/2